jgi:hypothetical protein
MAGRKPGVVLLLAGPTHSGKSTASQHLASKHGFFVYRLDRDLALAARAAQEGFSDPPAWLRAQAKVDRTALATAMARRVVEQFKASGRRDLAVDSLYHPADLMAARYPYPGAQLVYLKPEPLARLHSLSRQRGMSEERARAHLAAVDGQLHAPPVGDLPALERAARHVLVNDYHGSLEQGLEAVLNRVRSERGRGRA